MTTTVYQNHFSVERGCKTFRKLYENDSVAGDRVHCECTFLYLPGLVWTGPLVFINATTTAASSES